MASIQDWNVLKQLNQVFMQNIKNVFIFDTNAVFIITNCDKVYSFGMNTNGCLGLGHSNEVKEPQIINELSDQSVINIKLNSSVCNVLALSKTGCIYSWGGNEYGLLANGNTNNCFKPLIVESMVNVKIIDIRCAHIHCLALTDSNKVFSWGDSDSGRLGIGKCDDKTIISIPTQLSSLNDYKIVVIECGACHSFAMTDMGIIFVWGLNLFGQLGIGNTINTYIPTQLNLNNILIRKIRGGSHHSLLLSSDGDIYGFGVNSNGQIGDASKTHKSTAVKLDMPFKCEDIAARSHLSMAKLANGLCYVWGICSDKSYLSPKETEYSHINDVIIHFSKYKWNYDDISNCLNSVISKRFMVSFNDKKFSNFVFKIEDKMIFVQKQYLMSVCKHFESMFSGNNWNENSGNEVIITQYSYPVYHAFLKYLYTSYVDIETEYAFDLLDLANSYLEDDLKLKCEEIIKHDINLENVGAFYLSAVKYELNDLKECCLNFANNNLDAIENAPLLRALILKLKNKKFKH